MRQGDGSLGWPEESPFEAIVVTAGALEVPKALMNQLTVGGRLVIPVGPRQVQELRRIRRTGNDAFEEETHIGVRFVPLVAT